MRLIGSRSSSDAGGAHGGGDGQNRLRRLAGRRSLALLASLTLLLLAGVSLAVAGAFAPLVHPSPPAPPSPPQPPAPTITAHPADPTNQTSAHFTYTDAQSGVSYQCQLDGGAFGTCAASGTTYGPLSERSHNFKVRALAGSKTSPATSYSWTIDRTPPSASVDYPRNGDTLGAADWGAHCRDRATICGEARDDSGVSAVTISIQRDGGRWWGGSAFDQTAESFRTTTLDTRGHNSVRWSYPMPLPADGSFTVHVRAIDGAGNTTSSAAQTTSHFAIDTTPPPVPAIGTHPSASTTVKSASFGFSDSEHGATLLCRRDSARFERCTSPTSYASLSLGQHTFQVQARDAVGNTSAAVTYSWTIVKEVVETAGKPFTVSGNASGALAPGVTRSLAITLSNPNNVAITVTALGASVAPGSSNAGCDGPANLQLTQSNISAANPLAIPANGHVTLPSSAVSAPQVLMKDLPVNQDACKGASFTFTYSGSAHS
jgi:hypothetical protein